jgi:uncharacterized protein (TIGR02147 family)
MIGSRIASATPFWDAWFVKTPKAANMFDYTDYRAFLRDAYLERKGRGLSHRWLARHAGLSSPSFLTAVMDGKKNLARPTAQRVAVALSLTGDAAEYFETLVERDQARDPLDRRRLDASLARLRRYQDTHALASAQDAYHRTWYVPAIRELSLTARFEADPGWVAQTLRPKITTREAKDALLRLEQLGLLRPDAAGKLRATHRRVTTAPEPRSAQIARYHRTMIRRALAAIDDVARNERDISSVTLCVDATGLSGLKQRIQQIRRELLDEFDAGGSGAQVVQVNFQVFPLSKRLVEDSP